MIGIQSNRKRYDKTFPKIASVGLPNEHNSCYANALFQCLFAMHSFRQEIEQESFTGNKSTGRMLQRLFMLGFVFLQPLHRMNICVFALKSG